MDGTIPRARIAGWVNGNKGSSKLNRASSSLPSSPSSSSPFLLPPLLLSYPAPPLFPPPLTLALDHLIQSSPTSNPCLCWFLTKYQKTFRDGKMAQQGKGACHQGWHPQCLGLDLVEGESIVDGGGGGKLTWTNWLSCLPISFSSPPPRLLPLPVCCSETRSPDLGWPGTCYEKQTDLQLIEIHLPLLPRTKGMCHPAWFSQAVVSTWPYKASAACHICHDGLHPFKPWARGRPLQLPLWFIYHNNKINN